MQDTEQKHYFEQRAAAERAAAEQAADERAAQPHRELAKRYAEVARGESQPSAIPGAETFTGLPAEFTILD